MSLLDHPEVAKVAPGALGALVSLMWIRDTWPRRLAMFGAGAAFARFGTADMSRMTGLNDGLTGFLLGLFGMAVVASVFLGWEKLDVSIILRDAIRQFLRLPPKEL